MINKYRNGEKMYRIKRIKGMTFLILLCSLLSLTFTYCLSNVQAQFLILTIHSSKQEYFLSDEIVLFGNLTHLGENVYDGIVAIQIEDPENRTITIRVVSTGEVSQEDYPVRITQFYPSDAQGNPVTTTYEKGTFAYLTAYIKNTDILDHDLYFTVNIYDRYGKPWAMSRYIGRITSGETKLIITGYPIPYEFPSGTATAYAVALTNSPKNNGMPHCPEAKTTFQVATSELTPITTKSYQNGIYYLNFSMPNNSLPGNYTVYASSKYKGSTAKANLTFKVKVPDLNNDGTIDIYDLIIVASAYGSSEGDPNWNQAADINGDKTIDIYDMILVATCFGWEA